ncbi:conserved hypothetical protein [Anaeromyxobacter dehalogenans 2CP-1]|uniref:Uncharacterized protein n=1 Tax=Anaeromyxobacter dehalogenans (strain ATCC BAA-258 / DSM 21875 / 2CP-1) TaxID=455488 RepID=B8J5Q5_ANAD2|nr:conserved hypothetical protein [Anaeromyxobacter dehalogenans 2CP-1]
MFATVAPLVVVAAAGTVIVVHKLRERRRWANVKASGGRKSLVLNLFDRP